MKQAIAKGTALALAATLFIQACPDAQAAAKKKLRAKRLNITVGSSKKIVIRGKKKNARYTFKSSNRAIARVSSKGVVKALKAGTAKITVKETLKRKTRKLGVITVKCKRHSFGGPEDTRNASAPTPSAPSQTAAPAASASPASTAGSINTAAPTSSATPDETAVPVQTATPEPSLELKPVVYDVPADFDKSRDGVTYGTVQKVEYYSTTTEKNRKANIILPADYTEEKQYPVLYLLHGISGDQNEWVKGGKPEIIIGNLTAQGLAKEMIIVVPNCRARANDAACSEFSLEHYAAFDNFINDLRDNLMPYVEENYSIATGRKNTAIAGLSMGGRESLNIGLHMPETFGYIAAFSPGYGVFAYTANGVSEPGLFTEDTFLLPDEYKNNTLLMLNNGISEGGENAIGGTCHKALDKNNTPHIFYVTEGGHDFKVWKHGLYNFAIQIFQ